MEGKWGDGSFRLAKQMLLFVNSAYLIVRMHKHFGVLISSVQLLSCVRLFVTPWTIAHQASLSITTPGTWSINIRTRWIFFIHKTFVVGILKWSSIILFDPDLLFMCLWFHSSLYWALWSEHSVPEVACLQGALSLEEPDMLTDPLELAQSTLVGWEEGCCSQTCDSDVKGNAGDGDA